MHARSSAPARGSVCNPNFSKGCQRGCGLCTMRWRRLCTHDAGTDRRHKPRPTAICMFVGRRASVQILFLIREFDSCNTYTASKIRGEAELVKPETKQLQGFIKQPCARRVVGARRHPVASWPAAALRNLCTRVPHQSHSSARSGDGGAGSISTSSCSPGCQTCI